jgi:hypothetical protein
MKRFFNTLLFNKVDARGLCLFRIVWSMVVLSEVFHLFRNRHFIYDKVAFVNMGELNVEFIFYFWFLSLFCLAAGFYTRFAAILNYLFSVIIFSTLSNFYYAAYPTIISVNFVLIFVAIDRTLSVDAMLVKRKTGQATGRMVAAIHYILPLLAGLGFVYFNSALSKIYSPIWQKGLGMWAPSSLPMFITADMTPFLNQEWLVKFMGYLVIIFELVFPFIFRNRPLKVPLMFIGVFFHVGILVVFSIPGFAVAAICLYILMIPEKWMNRLFGAGQTTESPETAGKGLWGGTAGRADSPAVGHMLHFPAKKTGRPAGPLPWIQALPVVHGQSLQRLHAYHPGEVCCR